MPESFPMVTAAQFAVVLHVVRQLQRKSASEIALCDSRVRNERNNGSNTPSKRYPEVAVDVYLRVAAMHVAGCTT